VAAAAAAAAALDSSRRSRAGGQRSSSCPPARHQGPYGLVVALQPSPPNPLRFACVFWLFATLAPPCVIHPAPSPRPHACCAHACCTPFPGCCRYSNDVWELGILAFWQWHLQHPPV
jgi:hypothetical protein